MHKGKYFSFFLALTNVTVGLAANNQVDPDFEDPVTLSTATEIALKRDPRLSVNETDAEAAEGRIDQAGLRPNPVVGAEIENIAGTGPFRDVRGLEVTLGVRQLIETASKRERRTQLAERERELVDWERELIVADIEADVRRAFIDVLLAQESVNLRQEQLALAEHSEEETARLVDAARSPQVELTRAGLSVRRANFDLERAQGRLEAARSALAALWGMAPAPAFDVEGNVVLEESPPPLSELVGLLPKTASLGRYEAVDRTREAALSLEQARAKPNVEVFAGGRYFNEDDGNAGFFAGVEIPWPLFDKNQGNIRSARARVRAVEHERETARRTLLRQLSAAYGNLTFAFDEAKTARTELFPAAEKTLSEMETGYARGQYSQLAVLESHQTLFEVREAYLDALTRYTKAKVEIEAITRPAQLIR